MNLKVRLAIAAVLVAALAGGIVEYSKGAKNTDRPGRGSGQAVPVVVADAQTRTLPITFDGIGTVESLKTISVKSRVDGQIESAHFTEGGEVHAGDLLFKIDPRPIEASLKIAEANLARDQAQLSSAQRNLERYKTLSSQGYAPKQQLDETTAQVEALSATLRSDQASIDLAKLQLDFTDIRSPVDGVAGAELVHPGNLVKANDTSGLVTIRQVRPIYVTFSLPETMLPEVRSEVAAGPVETTVTIPGDSGAALTGNLVFIDNAVDPSTGTIKLKAEFPNSDERLVNGQFVNVALDVATAKDAVVVPSRAVQTGQKGPFVYLVGDDNRAHLQQVEAGESSDGVTIIRKGVEAGQTVVVDGQLRLAEGIAVSARRDEKADAQTADRRS
jgi:multidrug efflux system membrane fusion protein